MAAIDLVREQCGRCLHCAKPSCATACPIGNDIPEFLHLASCGKYGDATKLIGHPFGEVCGYVCPHEQYCRGGCVLSKKGLGVFMGAVEREVFAANPYRIERVGNAARGKRVAVVGAGVSGLTFASKLYEQGADVTVFEANGYLSTLRLIPSFRLPERALDAIEKQAKDKFCTVEQKVDGKSLASIQAQFDAAYIAAGTAKEYSLGVEGENFATPYSVFLKKSSVVGGKRVVVLGGGNTAMDCARLAVRNGADVTVAYRRQKQDMPAFDAEVRGAEEEGVKFVFNVAPAMLRRTSNGLVLTVAQTVSQGRERLTVTDVTSDMECAFVVSALGACADKELAQAAERLKLLSGGDFAGGKTVAQAVADGLRAARKTIENFNR